MRGGFLAEGDGDVLSGGAKSSRKSLRKSSRKSRRPRKSLRKADCHKYGDHTYLHRVGSKKQVFRGYAFKTAGGLECKDLLCNKHGRIVSKKQHRQGKRLYASLSPHQKLEAKKRFEEVRKSR